MKSGSRAAPSPARLPLRAARPASRNGKGDAVPGALCHGQPADLAAAARRKDRKFAGFGKKAAARCCMAQILLVLGAMRGHRLSGGEAVRGGWEIGVLRGMLFFLEGVLTGMGLFSIFAQAVDQGLLVRCLILGCLWAVWGKMGGAGCLLERD
jgi:hypothetical protein